jgi:addiction module RelB/DinJ family antitoxin
MDTVLETSKSNPEKMAETTGATPYVTISARVNADLKRNAQSVLEQNGLTVSAAVQRLLEHIVATGDFPFRQERPKLSKDEIVRRLQALQAFELPEPVNLTDDDIRQMRLREKHGLHFDD